MPHGDHVGDARLGCCCSQPYTVYVLLVLDRRAQGSLDRAGRCTRPSTHRLPCADPHTTRTPPAPWSLAVEPRRLGNPLIHHIRMYTQMLTCPPLLLLLPAICRGTCLYFQEYKRLAKTSHHDDGNAKLMFGSSPPEAPSLPPAIKAPTAPTSRSPP